MDERVERVIENSIGRWTTLDSDWQGVLVGAAIVVFIELSGVTIPW
jgi:hypothetical protein